MPASVPRITEVQVIPSYTLNITFADGTHRIIDLESELYGEIFEPLRDPAYFARVQISGRTIGWPNGADFSPEWIYEQAAAKAS